MIEFKSNIGGRFDSVADFVNMQNSALAITKFFLDSDLYFVISGCKRTEHGYTDGFVWVDEKIRYVEATDIDSDDIWIVSDNDGEGVSVEYADGSTHPVSYIYSAHYATSGSIDVDMQAENGKFPTLVDFFSNYVLAKNSDSLQEITTNSGFDASSFKNGYTYRDDEDYDTVSVGYEKSNKRFFIKFLNSYGNEYSKYYIDQNGTALTFSKNGQIVWQIGGELGELSINDMQLHNMDDNGEFNVKEWADMSEIVLDGDYLEDIFASTIFHQDTDWVHPIDSDTNAQIASLNVRQQGYKVFIYGILPKRYIMGADNANDIDPSASIESSPYVDIVSVYPSGSFSDATCAVLKTHVKLPDSIDPPDQSRIPGCVISSDVIIGNTLRMCNVELHVGTDNHLYIVGKPKCMKWREGGARLSFEYLVD